MTDDAQRWKEKYLKSIEQQEKLERRWNARLDLLRRGLVRSTLAAEGSDRAVDACMKEMREVVRTDDMDAKLSALIPRLEKAVLDSEQRRQVRVDQTRSALAALAGQLQRLALPRDVSKPLKKFAKSLDERAGQAREIPLLLSELSALQGQALASDEETPAAGARPGLLQRLFGHRETPEAAPAEPVTLAPLPDPAAPTTPVLEPALEFEPAADPPSTAFSQPEPVVLHPALPEAPAAALPPAPALEPALEQEPKPVLGPEPEPEPEPELAEPALLPPGHEDEQPPAADATPPLPEEIDATLFESWRAPEMEVVPAQVPQASVAPLVFLDSLPLPQVMAEALAAIDPHDLEEDLLYALPDSAEPSYSSVAGHIESTLLGLLGELSLPERHQPQAESMRVRLEHGLNWYELLPILDDLAVLMLAINDSGQHEFEIYLKQLNERLDAFQGHLQSASEGCADSRSAAQQLDSQLREHVGGLQHDVQDATDIDSLKRILEDRLEALIATMDVHQEQRDQREQEVAEKLQGLAERVASMEQEASGYRAHLEEQRQKALLDPLTGLPNRAAWSERLELAEQRFERSGGDLLLAMLDLDHFKQINDTYGHQAGDKVLKIIAGELRKRLRPEDFIARFGGEEFVLMMPDTVLEDGSQRLDRLRAVIAACPFHFKGQRVTVTLSGGVSAFQPAERSSSVLKRADEALYRAKKVGRNRIEAS